MEHESLICPEIKSHIICPTEKYGKISITGMLNIAEKIRPTHPTIMPELIATLKGPNSDRLHQCLISCHPSANHISK
jgi:hypothetical protein